MRNSFTLVEVLISTLIVFIIVNVFLNIFSNYRNLFDLISSKNSFVLKSSIVFLEQKNRKNLYEELYDFNITNDEIIHSLKKDKISFKKKRLFSQDVNLSNSSFKFIINSLQATSKFNRATAYELGIGGYEKGK